MDTGRAGNFFWDARDRQAAFFQSLCLAFLVALDDVSIDKCFSETFVLREILAKYIQIDNYNTLKSSGYDAQIVFNSERNMYRVVASTFVDKAGAVKSRNELRASKYPDAWLLFKK